VKRTRAVVEPLAAKAGAARAEPLDDGRRVRLEFGRAHAGGAPTRPAERDFAHYEVLKDLIDECIDLELNYRQSGHPGGSRSKVHMLRRAAPVRGDALGHPAAVASVRRSVRALRGPRRAARLRHSRRPQRGAPRPRRATGDPRFAFPEDGRFALTWEHLLGLRHRGGLPGHAEMSGRTLFLKANTGPSGHGMPFAAGEALALKLAGAGEVKVFVVEGEGGLTPGAAHETKNSAWGLGLSNLVFLVDWNDFGIDERPASAVVHGTPEDWFAPYGWRVNGTRRRHGVGPGHSRRPRREPRRQPGERPQHGVVPDAQGPRLRQAGRASHGVPHKLNAPEFWAARKEFMARYGVEYQGVDEPAPSDPAALAAQAEANLRIAMSVMRRDEKLVDWLSDRLLEIAATVPEEIEGFEGGSAGEAGNEPGPAPTAPWVPPRRRPGHLRLRALPRHDVAQARRSAAQPRRARATGARTSTPSPSATSAARCSSPAPRTWPSRPTSPASPSRSGTCPASATSSATRTRPARSSRPRSPNSPTPA
jgi:hypothetical protein